jgi:hypothetical protein
MSISNTYGLILIVARPCRNSVPIEVVRVLSNELRHPLWDYGDGCDGGITELYSKDLTCASCNIIGCGDGRKILAHIKRAGYSLKQSNFRPYHSYTCASAAKMGYWSKDVEVRRWKGKLCKVRRWIWVEERGGRPHGMRHVESGKWAVSAGGMVLNHECS